MRNLEILNEINKGALIGMESLKNIGDKLDNNDLKRELEEQYREYRSISNDIKEKFDEKEKLQEVPTTMKLMNKTGIVFNTMKDNSSSKIAEILIQGNDMGIIKGRKLLNESSNIDKDTEKILNHFISFQENNIESLKKYL